MESDVPTKKVSGLKKYVALVLITLLTLVGGLGYYKYVQFTKLQTSAASAIEENTELKKQVEKYMILKDELYAAENECKELMLTEEGNFARFSYCQNFLEFISSISTLAE